MTQLILGLGHKARHGKDNFARAVEDYYGAINAAVMKHSIGKPVIVQRNAFADALRKEVNAWLTTPSGRDWIGRDNLHDDYRVLGDSQFPLGRVIPDWVVPDPNPEISVQTPLGKHPKLLQWWGTEYRRAQDPAYWVKQWKASINPQADIVLTTDMRFHNEAAAIKEASGYTVNVVRLNQDGIPYVDPSRSATHASEIELDGYNYDHIIQSKDAVLAGELAVTLVHFLRARATKGK